MYGSIETLPAAGTAQREIARVARAQLAEFLGTPGRVSEIMNGKRELSMSMVRKVRDRFHVSADVLIGPPRLRKGLAA